MISEQDFKDLKKTFSRAFSTPDGAKVLEHLTKTYFEDETTMHENHAAMAFNEGQRMVVKYVRDMMKVEPDKVSPGKADTTNQVQQGESQ